jgi:hypothetical protein
MFQSTAFVFSKEEQRFLRHDPELIESGVLGQDELAGGCLIY